MSDSRPIGLLDSGVGGLSVLREVQRLLPGEAVRYVADQAHLPYGTRSVDELRALVERIVRFLIAQECKLIVIACNAANTAALHYLRAQFPDLPIVGMEPAVKPAAERTRSGVIGVLTTQTTAQGALYANIVKRFAQHVRVVTQICPELVTLVEQGAPEDASAQRTVAECLAPLQAAGADHIVLGCTHFPFLMRHMQAVLGDAVTLVDPAPAVARQVRRVLEARDALNSATRPGEALYFTSGAPEHFSRVATQLLGMPIQATLLD
ncbi:MAG: glutamate racemase [Candidatus Thermofonsia Clade 1 bacterium]|jgi:glutamate racemase|uniref:Glutamate racemase n=1 Tax=Candidatus Thermofonsia Clade 1 bacterium TaxID=2364210 RepID=A0A2M8PGK9_9CHLR|nr:MAG: glutamate racemase [Candidatus Thermofonsia Clade 1 bacterium]